MKEIEQLVLRAADPGSPLAARREAFGELVIRFQDMACGCAFAVLGDVYLAQDTAQEAFVVAWQKLAQLREPAAFPGWFKRIVLTQCNRLTRCKRLQIVPLEDAATIDPGPHASAERHDLLAKVLRAINALPENERLVTTRKLPLQLDYEDYREVDGIKQPFLIHWSMPGRIWGRKIDEIKQNVPLDDARFNPITMRP